MSNLLSTRRTSGAIPQDPSVDDNVVDLNAYRERRARSEHLVLDAQGRARVLGLLDELAAALSADLTSGEAA